MVKLKILSIEQQFKLADYDRLEREKETYKILTNNLSQARELARMKSDERLITHKENLNEYINEQGELIREHTKTMTTIVEQSRIQSKESTLGEWFEASPFISEIRKAHAGT